MVFFFAGPNGRDSRPVAPHADAARLSDGANKAVGTSFVENELRDLLTDKRVLFLGLGMGVLQRRVNDTSQVTTVEKSEGVVELFRVMYPGEADRMTIVVEDFFDHIRKSDETWNTIVLDAFDPEFRCLDYDNVSVLKERLAPAGHLIINRQGQREEFKRRAIECSGKCGFDMDIHELKLGQTVVVFCCE